MSVEITIRGNIGDGIQVREGERGGEQYKVLSFSVASTKLKKQIADGRETYVPVKTTWYKCAYWNKDVDVLHKNLQKGLPVTVVGEITDVGTYASKTTGEILPSIDVRVDSLYLNLNSKRLDTITLLPPREGDGNGSNYAPPSVSSVADEAGEADPF